MLVAQTPDLHHASTDNWLTGTKIKIQHVPSHAYALTRDNTIPETWSHARLHTGLTGLACMTHVRRYTLLQWIAQKIGSDTYNNCQNNDSECVIMFRSLFTQMIEKELHTRGENG